MKNEKTLNSASKTSLNEPTTPVKAPMERRNFLGVAVGSLLLGGLTLSACTNGNSEESKPEKETTPSNELEELPASLPNPNDDFGVDSNINMDTIDQYLGRADVAYRDVRMLFDPADYASIGGNADLATTIECFMVVPFPYLGSLPPLPVDGAYDGDVLFRIEWDDERNIKSAIPVYDHSLLLLEELFPKDKAIFLMCGGAGYAAFTKKLLLHLGWEENLLYNIGGNWEYTGGRGIDLITYDNNGNPTYFLWRADSPIIDFSMLSNSKNGGGNGSIGKPGSDTTRHRPCITGA